MIIVQKIYVSTTIQNIQRLILLTYGTGYAYSLSIGL